MDWLDLLAVPETLKSLLQHHSSKASILWHPAFSIVHLSHPYMTTGTTIALTIWTFVGKIMSLLQSFGGLQTKLSHTSKRKDRRKHISKGFHRKMLLKRSSGFRAYIHTFLVGKGKTEDTYWRTEDSGKISGPLRGEMRARMVLWHSICRCGV